MYVFIQTPFGQNWIAKQVTKRLSKNLHTKVSVKHVDFSLFNRMHLEGLLVEDQKGDTLLYAGDMKVRITDWFFFKKNVELKYIGLEDAIIKFQRTDSVWSQQFIFDRFGSPPTAASKKKGGMQLNLKKLDMKNVRFVKKDEWAGENMTAHIATLNLDADEVSFSKNVIEANSLLIDQPVFSIYKYRGRKPGSPEITTGTYTTASVDSVLKWNRGGWVMHIDKLKITNGIFKTDKQSDKPVLAGFDGKHIDFNNINGEFTDVRWINDSITAHLDLGAKERSGLEVKKLLADIKFTPQEMAFNSLDIQTNNSRIRHYFRMSYQDFGSMADFIHKVNMQGDFDGSEIDSDDIAFFAPALKTWKKKITLKGKIRGTVDALTGRELLVRAGSNTLLDGDISLTGLPDINQTFIDFKSNDFRTTYGDAVTIIPAMRRVTSPDLKKIQYVNFKGNFTGFIRDFVTFGTIQTNLGTLTTDINMKLPAGHEPVYSGTIATDNFRLGELLGDKNIGAVSLSAKVQGTGFNSKTRNTMIDGTIRFVDYQNYRYQNITVKGRLNKTLFEGVASIRDDNADLDLDGRIDFNSETPLFKLKADVARSNLKNLHITKDDIVFRGKLDLDFSSISIDNFLGDARITEAEISKDGHLLPFDSLIISSAYVGNEKRLTVVSNEFDASISGDFSIKDLPPAFTYLLNKYYPAFVKAPKLLPQNQDIKFNVRTFYVDEYLQLIDSSLSGFNNSHFSGSLNLAKNELSLTASVPQFKYKQYNFDEVKLTANGDIDKLLVTGEAKNIHINDSLSVPKAVFKISARNDSSVVSITAGANQTVEKADINALVRTKDGIDIEFDPSTFTINGKTWAIDEKGILSFKKNNPASGQLVLTEGDQKILLKTQPSSKGQWNDLTIELTKVNLGDFAPYIMPKNRLEGLLSGNIIVENPTGDFNITSSNLRTQYFRLDNDSLGEIKATVDYNKLTKELKIKGSTINTENYLGFDASIFIGDPSKELKNKIALKAKNFEIKYLERFLGNLFSDMKGFLTGDIDLEGAFKNLAVTGKGRLKNAGLKVNFTQCFYWINDTDIELTPQEINLDGIVLTDSVTRNPIYLKGGIEHQSFKNMFYDLYISTRKPGTRDENNNRPVQLLNTGYKDNKQFYGNVKGTGSLTLAGPQSEMYMTIDAFASTKDSSNITIPPSGSRESGIADFLVERKFGQEMTGGGISSNLTNIVYDVNVTAGPTVNMKVVLDDLTGDEIKGRGAGSLKIRSGTSEPLRMYGRYDIDEGNYTFTFQSFFKKPFDLKKGADNYIEWSGDPYDAKINLTATYTANNVSYAPLAGSLKNIDQGVSKARGDVYVVARLTDKLFEPRIDFSLDFPASSVVNSDPTLAFSLQQLQKNMNEMNKQATYLVVFGIFAPVESGGNASAQIQEIATNSLSGIFFNVVNDQVKKVVSSIFKNEKLSFNFSSSVYNRNVIDPESKFSLGSNVNASIGSSLFKNKVIISIGGSVEGLLQSGTIQQDVTGLLNASIEVLLNPSGTFRANLFFRQNTDYLSNSSSGAGRMNRGGIGLSYRKDANTIGGLFFPKKNKKQAPVPPPEEKAIPPKEEPKKEE